MENLLLRINSFKLLIFFNAGPTRILLNFFSEILWNFRAHIHNLFIFTFVRIFICIMPMGHRRHRRSGRRNVASFGRRVRSIVNANLETKFRALNAITPITATPVVIDMTALAQGDNRNERVGFEVRLVEIRVQFIVINLDIGIPFTYRMFIYKDKGQTAGALPPPPADLVSVADTDRFIIKMDKFVSVAQSASGAARVHMWTFTKRWPSTQSGTVVQYGTDLQDSGIKNNWYLSFQSDDAVVTGNLSLRYIIKASYKDA